MNPRSGPGIFKKNIPKPKQKNSFFEGPKWICNKCKSEYNSVAEATKCIKSHLFVCEICELYFKDKNQLNQHHLTHKKNKCRVCDKEFTSRTKLFKHLRISCTEDQVLKEAQENEKYLNYEKAIDLYDRIEKPEEAARVRKIVANQKKVDQTVVQGDQITKTEIKDSVLNRSNVGGGSSKMQELRELKEMLAEGIIDEDEFKQMKKEILGK